MSSNCMHSGSEEHLGSQFRPRTGHDVEAVDAESRFQFEIRCDTWPAVAFYVLAHRFLLGTGRYMYRPIFSAGSTFTAPMAGQCS